MSLNGFDIDGLRELVSSIAESQGLTLYDLELTAQRGRPVLRVLIDRDDVERGVSVAECASVSRELSQIFDAEDPVSSAYVLEVSSPGVERPLRRIDHYRSAVGDPVKLTLREGVGDRSVVRGILETVEEDQFVVAIAPKRKKVKKGQKVKEVPLEQWERATISANHVQRATTLFDLSEPQ